MVQITSRKQLERWLKDKPIEWAHVLSARAALRALPYSFTFRTDDMWIEAYSHNMFYANMVLWIAVTLPNHNIDDAVTIQNRIFNDAADSARSAGRGAADAADAAREAIRALDDVVNANGAASAAHYSAEAAADAARAEAFVLNESAYSEHHASAEVARAVAWSNLSHDCVRLEERIAAAALGSEKLWPLSIPEGWDRIWALGAQRLLSLSPPNGQNTRVWIDWYNRRIDGSNAAFDIPGDENRSEDRAILARLVDAYKGDFWNNEPVYVDAMLQRWIEEARARVSDESANDHETPAYETIPTIPVETASPDVTPEVKSFEVREVIANKEFDSQADKEVSDFDEAIAVLSAIVSALLAALPGNAPRIFAANLEIYEAELDKHGAKPRIGVLVRMERAIRSQYEADPDMFDIGVSTNLESFFQSHRELMTIYLQTSESILVNLPAVNDLSRQSEAARNDLTDLSPEPQDARSPVFDTDASGRIAISAHAGADRLRTDVQAQARHALARRMAQALGDALRGHNNAGYLTEMIEAYVEALGDRAEAADPSILVFTGDQLREAIAKHRLAGPDDDLQPLPSAADRDASGFISAHNMYTGSDPYLDDLDRTTRGPDAPLPAVDPAEIEAITERAFDDDILAESSRDYFVAAMAIAPAAYDPTDRHSRFASGLAQNFARYSIEFLAAYPDEAAWAGLAAGVGAVATFGVAATLTAVSAVVGGVVAVGSVAYHLARNIIANEDKYRKLLGTSPAGEHNFNRAIRFLKSLPYESLKDDR